MLQIEFPAMGTTVTAIGEEEAGLDAVRALFGEVESCCSRFRSDSALSRLNAEPGTAVRVPEELLEVLQAAWWARTTTGGLVDASVGAAVSAWGYDRSIELVTGRPTAPDPIRRGRWHLEGSVLTRDPGVSLDLGGIAKGWACDRAVETGPAQVVSAGGDVRSDHSETVVEVTAPDGTVAARLLLGRGALATSSTSRRRWKVAGNDVSHLVDPRTMEPVRSSVASASAVAATALEAEVAAKGVLLLGEEGPAWAASCSWIQGTVIVWQDGTVATTGALELAA